MASLNLKHINKIYPNGYQAVKELDLDVSDGEFVSLLGTSGCGKSTTLRMVAGLEDVTGGEILIDNKLSNDVSPKDRGIAMVFQSYALFPHMTVSANIGFGLKIRKTPENTKQEKIKWAVELLDLKGMENRKPAQLSGGQRQRVALGRALVLDPSVLLLDEPLSNLDAKLRIKMRTELKRIHKELKATIIYVTHDQSEAMTLSTKIAIMNGGKIVQVGTPYEIYNDPVDMFVASFIGSPQMNFIEGSLVSENGGYYLEYAEGRFALPNTLKEKISRLKGKEVVLGIRPEDIQLSFEKTENSIAAVTVVTETLGSDDYVAVSRSNKRDLISIRLAPDSKISPDQNIYMTSKNNKLYIFDKETK